MAVMQAIEASADFRAMGCLLDRATALVEVDCQSQLIPAFFNQR
jgi:hypothetical protein